VSSAILITMHRAKGEGPTNHVCGVKRRGTNHQEKRGLRKTQFGQGSRIRPRDLIGGMESERVLEVQNKAIPLKSRFVNATKEREDAFRTREEAGQHV